MRVLISLKRPWAIPHAKRPGPQGDPGRRDVTTIATGY
jgi:hypothetical protein